jgi:hypothetical protein
MTARFYTFAVASVAIIVVAGAVWAKANGPQAGIPDGARIDVASLHSAAYVAGLPVVQVDEPF